MRRRKWTPRGWMWTDNPKPAFDLAVDMAIKTGQWDRVERLPDPECSRCSGRGQVGRDRYLGGFIACGCVQTAEAKERYRRSKGVCG